jgi:DNA polymerase III subunit delta
MARSKNPGISIEEFHDALKKNKIAPLYFFFGEEDFLLEEALEKLKNTALDDSSRGFNLDLFYGGETDGKDVISHASMFPMMGDRKVVIVRDFEKLPNKEVLIPYFENPSSTTVLVIISSNVDLRLKTYKLLSERAVTIKFDQLKDYQIPGWMKSRIESLGKTISQDAIQLLHTYSDRSLGEIQNEIDKLFTYVAERKNIMVDDVNAVIGVRREYNIFELQKTIGSRNIPRSFEILDRMLESGEKANLLIASLTKYFQKLWVVQEMRQKGKTVQDIAKFLNLNPQYPKFVEEYTNASYNFSLNEFERIFDSLIEADTKLKTSGGETRLIMTVLLYGLINRGIPSPVEV